MGTNQKYIEDMVELSRRVVTIADMWVLYEVWYGQLRDWQKWKAQVRKCYLRGASTLELRMAMSMGSRSFIRVFMIKIGMY